MTTALNPSSPPTFEPAQTGPSDGEPAVASTVNVPMLGLVNCCEAARLASYGNWRRRFTINASGDCTVRPMGAVLLKSGGSWYEIESQTDLTETFAGLVASTIYNVYVYDTGGGTLGLQASVDAPDAGLFYKTADEQYGWIGVFCTDSAGTVQPMTASDGSYSYLSQSAVSGGNLVLSAGNATVNTNVSLAACVPSYARSALIQYQTNTAGATGLFEYLSSVSKYLAFDYVSGGPIGGPYGQFTAPLDGSSPLFKYKVNAAGDSTSCWVVGFEL